MVRAVVPPTVPTRRVRVCLHAGNSVQEVDRLVARIESWVKLQIGPANVLDDGGVVVKARL